MQFHHEGELIAIDGLAQFNPCAFGWVNDPWRRFWSVDLRIGSSIFLKPLQCNRQFAKGNSLSTARCRFERCFLEFCSGKALKQDWCCCGSAGNSWNRAIVSPANPDTQYMTTIITNRPGIPISVACSGFIGNSKRSCTRRRRCTRQNITHMPYGIRL